MPSIIILDAGPLSNTVIPLAKSGKAPTASEQCRQWLQDCEQSGTTLLVPAIAYYETLREMERRRAFGQISRFKRFVFSKLDRYVPLTTAHLERAAQMWGAARNAGFPTSSALALDVDVILAGQVLSLGLPASDYIVATTNVGHMARFVPCDLWQNITP